MDYFGLGDVLSYGDLNALVYLLRKFKRLTSDLELGETDVSSDYGVYHFGTGLTSVGGNYIIESPVTITSSDVLRNCLYSFIFTVVDVNLSGTVNKRTVSVTGDTGNYGQLSITLPMDLIGSDEQILPDFSVDIVFDPHEYYTSVSDLNVSLDCEEDYIIKDETNLINAYITDSGGSPVIGITVAFNVNGTVYTATTDSDGVAELEYTGLGSVGKVTVNALGEELVFFDGGVLAEYTGNSITLHNSPFNSNWLVSNGAVVIDWGDGTQSTVNNPTTSLTHIYTDNQTRHSIVFIGEVTGLGSFCFSHCSGLTSVTIPDSVTGLGSFCFGDCSGLTSVTIPDSVTILGVSCFGGCSSLIDYQLYWKNGAIKQYDTNKMPNNTNSIFTVPAGEISNYESAGYPSGKLVERSPSVDNITITCDKPVTQTGETSTITITATSENNPVAGALLGYVIKHGSTTIDSGTTSATDNNGQATISYTGTGIGDVDVIVSYGSLLQETYIVEDCLYYGNWNKITTDFLSTNFVSGRTIWYLNTNYQTDVELSFKFKNNVPTQFLAGFGDTNGTSTAWAKLMFYRIGTTSWALFKDNSSVSLSGVSATTDTIFKLQTQNLHTIKAYIDDTLKSTQSTNSSYGLNIRFDDYTSYPMELEYLKVKAL